MYTLLKGKSEGLHDELVDFTRKLIQIPSPSLKEGEVANHVSAEMERLRYDRVACDGAGNVVGFIMGDRGKPTVLLKSHMDTIVAKPEDWTFNPYGAEECEGCIYGLGAADCKGGVATQLYAGALLKRSLLPLEGNLVVAAAVAEENGRSIGVRNLLEQTLPEWMLTPDYAILGEPTNLGLYYGHEGWAEFEIRIHGCDEFAVYDSVGAIADDFQALAAVEHPGVCEEISMRQPTYSNQDGITSGKFRIMRRMHESEHVKEVLDRMQHEARLLTPSAGSLQVNVEVADGRQKLYTGRSAIVRNAVEAWRTDPFHSLIERSRQVLASAGCSAMPGKWSLEHLGMGTAGSVLSNEFNIPTIGYGPGDETVAHQPDEYVTVQNLQEAV